MALSDVTKLAVYQALDEFDAIGRNAFLEKYGFSKARSYYVVRGSKRYDSKAIMGAAHGYARPDLGPLRPQNFSGGEASIKRPLERLDFEVKQIGTRYPDWTRDEHILALDFYLRYRPSFPSQQSPEIAGLSRDIRAAAQRVGLTGDENFRNPNGVYMKLQNFSRIDPSFVERGRKGLTRGSNDEQRVWNEFASDPDRLASVAATIRAHLGEPIGQLDETIEADEPEVAEAAEGRLITRLHRTRERSRKLVRRKKDAVLKIKGRLECEACRFDFQLFYGERGSDFIECHHTKPVHSMKPGEKTKLKDLALVCANCHRMIHTRTPWLSLDQLKELIRRSR